MDPLDPNSFWNVLLLGGLLLIVFSAFQGPIEVKAGGNALSGQLAPPPQRRPLLWIGIAFVAAAIVLRSLPNWGGLVSPIQDSKAPEPPKPQTSIHFVRATAGLAQLSVSTDKPEPLASLKVVARHAVPAPPKFGDNVVVYVGPITLLGKTRLFIYQGTLPGTDGIDYQALQPKVANSGVIYDHEVGNGPIDFTWNGRKYQAVIKLNWFLKGENYALIEVYSL